MNLKSRIARLEVVRTPAHPRTMRDIPIWIWDGILNETVSDRDLAPYVHLLTEFYSLTRLWQMDPRGLVAFFPSDHHFTNDEGFITHIDLAFAQAKAHPERVILLGIEPEAPEDAYGWIEPE
jgi:mannose-1-phosphate guanylyltransferase